MAIKCELGSDKDRGPGHGVLKITGLGTVEAPVDLSLMRNQGTEPYLGLSRAWQGTEIWHQVSDFEDEGDAVVVRVGPDIVDPIVALPSNVAYRLTIAMGASKQAGTLKINRPLLGSTAAAEEAAPLPPPPVQEPDPAPIQAVEPELPAEPIVEDEAPPPVTQQPSDLPKPKSLAPVVAVAAVLLLLVGGGAAAYFNCWIPGFGPAACKEEALEDKTAETEKAKEQLDESKTEQVAKAVAASSCSGLGAEECYGVAKTAMEKKEIENARQLFQQAARLGSVHANLRVAEMYDPDTWSAEASPEEQPDWETAAYWYEEAARKGDADGQIGAGRVLCKHATDSFEQERGLSFLQKASQQGGGEEIQSLLKECEAKVQ